MTRAAGLLLALLVRSADAATPFRHAWGTVADMMAMHGTYRAVPPQADIEFVARNYAAVTTSTGCSAAVNTTHTIEQSVLAVASRIKTVNPVVPVGMYWRSDFALELAGCSGFAGEWAAHPEWRLKDDSGKLLMQGDSYYIDYANPDAAAFFARVLVNVTKATLSSGKPVLDYIYIDGDPVESTTHSYHTGIGPARSAAIVDAIYSCFASIQGELDRAGLGQKVILNGLDTQWAAQRHVGTGVAGSMFDHWSILQFLDRQTGEFNKDMMDQAFALVGSALLANVTTKIKGWPGPIIAQKDKYPPNIPTPATPAELQQVAADRFNSELALFLLVATANDFWVYSWFWSWDDYVPNKPASSVPPGFFPQAACTVGAPAGPAARVAGTWTYTRKFENASVFVDLGNRTASRVDFAHC